MDTLAPRNTPIIISSVLLLYDYLLTFDLEANYVWTHPLTFRSAIFFLNRYTPFVDTFLSLSSLSAFLTAEGEIIYVALIVWKYIVSMRLHVTPEGCASYGPVNGLLYMGSFILLAFSETGECLVHLVLTALLMTAIVLAILSVIKGYRDLRNTRERWVVELYKDGAPFSEFLFLRCFLRLIGLLYYLYLLVISVFNIFSPWIQPAWGPFLLVPQRVLHSIFCNRVLFFLFKVGFDEERERGRLQGGYYGGRAGDWGTSREEGEEVRFTTVQMDTGT
ncbi:hypothetical protein WG66_016785 [Moniliophthora roreri]|nr:hypothetical protein WG66_016785 [Moniliophthora roreri]